MGQNLLCVLQSLGHLSILAVQGSCQGILTPLSLQIDIGHQFLLAGKDDLSLVSEVDLDDFVAESEHDGMLGLHPFLDITIPSIRSCIFVEVNFVVGIEIVPEMLKKSDFLLELSFRGIVTDPVRSDCISFIPRLLLDVFEVLSIFVNNDLGRIIEINPG